MEFGIRDFSRHQGATAQKTAARLRLEYFSRPPPRFRELPHLGYAFVEVTRGHALHDSRRSTSAGAALLSAALPGAKPRRPSCFAFGGRLPACLPLCNALCISGAYNFNDSFARHDLPSVSPRVRARGKRGGAGKAVYNSQPFFRFNSSQGPS